MRGVSARKVYLLRYANSRKISLLSNFSFKITDFLCGASARKYDC